MYKLLVADDEPLVAKFVQYVADTYKLPIRLVDTAKNGEDAISLIREYCPDIVILDIQMPKISGLDVADFISTQYPKTKIIMMSAYDYFEYAQRAIISRVVDYLVKPVHPEQLIKVIKKTICMITKEKLQDEKQQREAKIFELAKPILVEKAIHTAVVADSAKLSRCMKSKELAPREEHLTTVGSFIIWHKNETAALCREKLQSLVHKLNVSMEGCVFILPESENKCIFVAENHIDCVKAGKTLEHLAPAYEGVFVYGDVHDFYSLPQAYAVVNEEVERRLFWRASGLVHLKEKNRVSMSQCALIYFIADLIQIYFLEGRQEIYRKAKERIERLMEELQDQKPTSSQIKIYMSGVITVILSRFMENDFEEEKVRDIMEKTVDRIEAIDSYMALSKAMYLFNDDMVFGLLASSSSSSAEEVVRWIEGYVQVNYANPINLTSISHLVYLSECYISRIFKQMNGISFKQYLTKVRIEKAEELLKNGKCSVAQVGEAVGFHDPNYFSYVFKKNTGTVASSLRSF